MCTSMYIYKDICYEELAHTVVEVYCMYIYKEIYYKELAHTVAEVYKSEICWVSQQPVSRKGDIPVQVQRFSAWK